MGTKSFPQKVGVFYELQFIAPLELLDGVFKAAGGAAVGGFPCHAQSNGRVGPGKLGAFLSPGSVLLHAAVKIGRDAGIQRTILALDDVNIVQKHPSSAAVSTIVAQICEEKKGLRNAKN